MSKSKKYIDYKIEKEEEGYLISLPLKDEDCVETYFLNLLGEHKEEDRVKLLNKRVKSRYNSECSCGHYYPYEKLVYSQKSKGRLVSPMMPLNCCYNCYLIKKYGTINRVEIGKKKKENMLNRLKFAKKKIKEINLIDR